MVKAVTDAGYDYIAMDAELTRYGGVETRDEGLLYAKWLKEHEGQYDGVIFLHADLRGRKRRHHRAAGRGRADPDAGLPGRDRQDGIFAHQPGRVLRKILGDGRVYPVSGALYGDESPTWFIRCQRGIRRRT